MGLPEPVPHTLKCIFLIQPAYVPNEAPKAQRGEGICLTALGQVTVRSGSGCLSLSLQPLPLFADYLTKHPEIGAWVTLFSACLL